MDLINENIPYENEKINLIITSSLLNNSDNIIYNSKNSNSILINNYYLEYSSIHIDSDMKKNKSSLIITNNLLEKNDLLLIILTDSNEDSNIYLNTLKNILDKDNYKEYNINSISYIFSDLNKDNKTIIDDLYDISSIFNNNILLTLKIKYNDDIIYSSFKIFIINNSYENICPYICINHKEYDIIFLKNKIDNLLTEEKKIQKQINNLPMLNTDFIENINSFKKETFDYFSKFINNIEKTYTQFNTTKLLTKNDFSNIIKEIKSLMDKINKENYKFKQSKIYKEYIEIYKNTNLSKKTEENLKSLFTKFNNLNEELVNLLETSDINKKEIANLKHLTKVLQNQVKQEKSKNISNMKENNNNTLYNTIIENKLTLSNNNLFKKRESQKRKSFFNSIKLTNTLTKKNINRNNKRNSSMDNIPIMANDKASEDNRYNDLKYLKNKINQLNDTITNLKSSNEILQKSNEKMKRDINNLNKIIAKLRRNNEENEENEFLHKSSSIKTFRIIKPKILDFKKIQYSGQKRHKNKNKNLFLNNTINNDTIFSENKNKTITTSKHKSNKKIINKSNNKKKINSENKTNNINNKANNNNKEKNINNINNINTINYTNNTNSSNYFNSINDINNLNDLNNINTTLNEDKHLAILQKIHDENKNMYKKINDYYYKNFDYVSPEKDRELNDSIEENKYTINNSTSKKPKKNKKINHNNLKLYNTNVKGNNKSSVAKIKFIKANNNK